MKHYTVGFVFNSDLTRVLLIHKLRPEWQHGKINGLGGKYEDGETCEECISREVREESGLITNPDQWKRVATFRSEEFCVDVATCAYSGEESDAQTLETEKVEWFDVGSLPENSINNLAWLIPMCIGKLTHKGVDRFGDERYYDITFVEESKDK